MLASHCSSLPNVIANPTQGATGYIVTAVRPFTQVSFGRVWIVIFA